MNLNIIQYYYFLGIGGIGMSALAQYFHVIGKTVAGYDKRLTDLTKKIEKQGILITYKDSINTLPFWINPKNTLIIYTPALTKNHKQWNFLKTQSYCIKKRAEVLSLIIKNSFCLAIAGTHGKTTTCALLGHILYNSGKKSITFLGGISENYQSNLILRGEEISVIEADEFDKSFLNLSPDIICITSLDPDHLDIYKDKKTLENTYKKFIKLLKPKGKLFIKKGLPISGGITYSVNSPSNYYSNNLRLENGDWFFDFHTPKETYKKLPLMMPGLHNLENTTAALSIAIQMNLTINQIKKALISFKGVKRRFSIHHKSKEKIYIDDYAHHPTEINALITTTREYFPNKKILGIFQPHLFSRTKDFEELFIKSLEQLDILILLEIYPAREIPIKKITSKNLLKKINIQDKEISKFSNILQKIYIKKFDILLTIGAGDIEKLIIPIKKWLDKKYN